MALTHCLCASSTHLWCGRRFLMTKSCRVCPGSLRAKVRGDANAFTAATPGMGKAFAWNAARENIICRFWLGLTLGAVRIELQKSVYWLDGWANGSRFAVDAHGQVSGGRRVWITGTIRDSFRSVDWTVVEERITDQFATSTPDWSVVQHSRHEVLAILFRSFCVVRDSVDTVQDEWSEDFIHFKSDVTTAIVCFGPFGDEWQHAIVNVRSDCQQCFSDRFGDRSFVRFDLFLDLVHRQVTKGSIDR